MCKEPDRVCDRVFFRIPRRQALPVGSRRVASPAPASLGFGSRWVGCVWFLDTSDRTQIGERRIRYSGPEEVKCATTCEAQVAEDLPQRTEPSLDSNSVSAVF